MNRYGRFAQEMWQQLAPHAYSEIPDPNSHFSMIGEQAENQIIELAIQLEGDDRPGETYFEKVGRIEAAKRQAEEIVREDMLIPPPASREIDEDEGPSDPGLQAVMELRAWQQQMLDEAIYGDEE